MKTLKRSNAWPARCDAVRLMRRSSSAEEAAASAQELRLAEQWIYRQCLEEKDRALRDALHTVAFLCRRISMLQGLYASPKEAS